MHRRQSADGTGSGHRHPSHVWVEAGSRRSPGLLLGWRRGADGWEGRVVVAYGGGPTTPGVAESWVPAERLRPVNASE